jgi:hypothetical protein
MRILVTLLAFSTALRGLGENPRESHEHHYVFFGRDRELLSGHPFLKMTGFEGAQITYAWKQLEPRMDEYEFSEIDVDLQTLSAHKKKLWIQLQDATFMPGNKAVPRYLLQGAEFNGGANPQYNGEGSIEGWVARRWDKTVRERFHKLLEKLGERFDGVITGINLQETSIGISEEGIAHAPGFTYAGYRDGIKSNMAALRRAFKNSVPMHYVNFMPGEALPEVDHAFMRSLFEYGEKIEVAIGAPDLLPKRPFQQAHAYRFMKENKNGNLTIGIAIQDGNYRGETGETEAPKPGEKWPDIVPELARYATETLGASYVFWSIQEPYFSANVIPFFSQWDGRPAGIPAAGSDATAPCPF